jgi:membrane protease YdiL (CAAX protease family)
MDRRIGPLVEPLVLLAITLPLAVTFHLPTLWFFTPFVLITVLRRDAAQYGVTLQGCGTFRFHLAVCALVFGPYLLGHYGFGRIVLGRVFHPTLPPDFGQRVIEQMLFIGLSEEFFFRGYAQTQFNRYFGRPYRFLGAQWGWGLILAAILFGVCHVIDGDVTRLRTVFFGLFVGWLRERTQSIGVPAAYHGVSNLLYDFMQRSLH